MNSVRSTVMLCLVFITMVVIMFVISTTRTPALSTEELASKGVALLPTPREIAAFNLVDQDNQPFGIEQLQGQWTFAFFGFTHCPDICPTSMAVMSQAEERLIGQGFGPIVDSAIDNGEGSRPTLRGGAGGETKSSKFPPFVGMLVSVDPERDDVATLAPYVGAFSPTFVGLTGAHAEIAGLAQQLNVAFAKVPMADGGYQVDHSGNIVIINPRGHYHGYIKMPHNAETIALAYTSLASEF